MISSEFHIKSMMNLVTPHATLKGRRTKMAEGRKVKVHPVVLFSIIDSFERRKEDAKRVIGTLLGTVDANAVTITNTFCVPHTESDDEVAFDMEFARNMYDLHRKVNPTEVIVGWYATGKDITEHSVLIHEYYSRESKCPVHLTVNTDLRPGAEIDFKAFISKPIGVPGKTQGMMFSPVPSHVEYYNAERVAVDRIKLGANNRAGVVSLPTDFENVLNATSTLSTMLDAVLQHVNNVLAGNAPMDPKIGRYLMDLVCTVPHMEEDEFDTMLNNNINDLLMVRYLTNVVKSQVALNEKLVNTTVIQPT
uniref:Eukaryotic translation initiation factor 3 subunit F n=2 Tax=Ciona intestinalis TaxID=7719 RepID=F7A5A0_CIOIN